MKLLKKALSFLLVFCMVLGLASFLPAKEAKAADEKSFYKIVHLDCGRKYFTVDWVKSLIDEMKKDGYTHLELAFGNDGLRFLLDDMSVTVNGTTYSSDEVKAGIQAGNKTYYDAGTVNEWSQSDMDAIITYAKTAGIEIIPLLNTPGHMDAIIDAMEYVGISDPAFTAGSYGTSARTVDLENKAAVAFTQAFVQKYINYFAGKGCSLFNLGTDEYANDILINYSGMGFGYLQNQSKYRNFVSYVNTLADAVTKAGMTPMAFNDGIYYNSDTNSGTFNNDIIVTYWSNGWGNYSPASAQFLADKGFELVNTHGDFYYVLGKSDNFDSDSAYASNWDNKKFPGTTFTEDQAGAMFCIWCDVPGAETEDTITSKLMSGNSNVLAAMSTAMGYNESGGSGSGDGNTGDGVDVTEEKTIIVTVGNTATAVIEGSNYSNNINNTDLDTSIATVSAKYEQVEGSTVKTLGNTVSMNSNGTYTGVISDGNGNYLVLNGTTISSTTDINQATEWSVTRSGNNKNTTYTIQSGSYYLSHNNNNSLTASTSSSNSSWYYSSGFYYSSNNRSHYLRTNNGTWQLSTTNSSKGQLYSVTTTTTEPVNATTVTFTGVAVGTTYVTVGNTRYTINVTAEDLSKVTPLTVEYWITNRQVTANNATSGTIAASASGVYSESGALFSDLVPVAGTAEGNDVVFWKGTRLASNNQQTTGSGVDKTTSGTDFTYIRYWDKTWAYSADGETWTNVANGDQIVAYYLQKTEVTNEVTTQVVDWGPTQDSWSSLSYLGTKYVLVDYTVKYESGDETPASFPTANSLAFHCDTSTTKNGYYYRTIGMTRAEETSDYEVYMITVTPTSDNPGTTLASTAAGNTSYSYSYNGTEVVAWAATQEDLDNSGLGTYTSISGAFTYSIGGDPIVSGLEIYRQQGMKVTYYVRAKATEDSLSVHYIDQTANQEFYNYNIVVNSGTTFDEGIALSGGNLVNSSVTNSLGKKQTVSADLSTMPAIDVQYRYSNYNCVKVERSEDGKDVYLYYTFNNTHSFVVDFGLPLLISESDLKLEDGLILKSVGSAKYGTAAISEDGKSITYTPDKVFEGIETFSVILTGTDGSITHQIYIYPATTVYYEEGFATLEGFTGGSKGTETQATEAVGSKKNVYGYDAAYDAAYDDSVGENAGSQATSRAYGDKATFTFTGTGVGIYANCTTGTGRLMIQVKNAKTNKLVQVETALLNGKTDFTDEQEVTGYNVPVAVFKDLDYGTYTVTISHIKTSSASESASDEIVNLDGFRVYNTLNDTAEATYAQDREEAVSFIEVRDLVLSAVDLNGYDEQTGSDEETGYNGQYGSGEDIISQVFSKVNDSEAEGAILNGNESYSATDLQDLIDNGPKNEVYLFKDQTLVLNVNTNRDVQIGLKALNAATTYTVNGGDTQNLNASTDMFYTVSQLTDGTITITNTGGGILSVTMLKICDAPEDAIQPITEDNIKDALTVLGYVEPEVSYADATLNIALKDEKGNEVASTALTANGVPGEINTFPAAAIKEAVDSILPENYELTDASYSDVEVAYGESDDISFVVSRNEVKPSEPVSVIHKIINSIVSFFDKIFRR